MAPRRETGQPEGALPPPYIGSLTPGSGPTAGGTTVTITGTGLATTQTVRFGTTAVVPTIDSDSQITVATPPQPPGTVPVVVTAIGGVADDEVFTYTATPGLTGISPTTGPATGGTTVVLTGTNLAQTTGVSFGSAPAAFTAVSDTQINAIAPAHTPGPATVTVTTPGGTATAPDPFTYT
ncbi:cell surface protein [Streptomyces sp. PRh5]|uniref:IPT/TIG domain-containing protein n=1 Tax=Streptomyces sp. PRh5 TaxID=1158056 RepID=UPI000451E1BF|nr:IPT/TIG domain-containing protein [Streptomyces sp. PRh5]EXU66553.1 cell surface protein [Streptomyces sp. PRh5]